MPTRDNFLPGPGEPGLVSVLVPTYERGTLIGEALDSLLAQTYEKFEAIVVDDGSTDDTRAVVAAYQDPRIKYFYKPNGGLSSARNFGLDRASGEFIAFLDSDDTWLPWKLAAQVELFRRHTEVGMSWTDMSSFVTSGVIVNERHLRTYYAVYSRFEVTKLCTRSGTLGSLSTDAPPAHGPALYYIGSVFREMFFGNLVHPPTAVVRRSRLQKSGPWEPEVTGHGADDYHFYLRVTEQGPVAFIDAPTMHYRIHAHQISTANSLAESHADLRLVNHWTPRVAGSIPQTLIRQRLASAHALVGNEELAAGNSRAARGHLWKSLSLRPSARTLLRLTLSVVDRRALSFARGVKRRLAG
jgi:Glycosyl transferase family 2